MEQPIIIVTGASGFVGRHLLESLRDQYRIVGLDWRSQEQSGAPKHPSIRWAQADITDAEGMNRALAEALGGDKAELMLHLAAYYDFEGEDSPGPYWSTNVDGLRNVLDACVRFGVPRFVFASSLAACRFPKPGDALTETTPPDGEHIYARTKRSGEEMLAEYEGRLRSVIVRFAAMFSDYCEYPPLFEFLKTWTSSAWNARMIGGHGLSAIPYLHVRDATRFLRALLHRFDDLDDCEVVIASPDGSTSHLELFEVATDSYFYERRKPILIPKLLIRPGIWARYLMGRVTGNVPFERPWMASYVDLAMNTDATRTRHRLAWRPRPRLSILRRLPLLIENFRAFPVEWSHRNEGAARRPASRPNLVIHTLLRKHQTEIFDRLTAVLTEQARSGQFRSYQELAAGERAWNHTLALSNLMSSVRTRERSFFVDYCAGLARRRYEQGFSAAEVTSALTELERIVLLVLREDDETRPVEHGLYAHISITMQFAVDEIEEVFEELEARRRLSSSPTPFSMANPPSENEDGRTHDRVPHESEDNERRRAQE